MTFEVYNRTNRLIARIENEKTITYLEPSFAEALERIHVDSCFPFHMNGQAERVFGRGVTYINKGDKLYPLALKMHFQAKYLTHPEDYTDHPITQKGENS